MLRFCTVGGNVAVHNIEASPSAGSAGCNFSEAATVYKYTPVSTVASGCSWKTDGSCMVSCIQSTSGKASSKVVLTYCKGSVFTSSEIHLAAQTSRPISATNAVVFMKTSSKPRLIAADDDRVLIYDIASRKCTKEYPVSTRASLACLESNFNDSFIAAGTAESEIFLINTVTNHVKPLSVKNQRSGILSLKYSKLSKAHLAASCGDGSIVLIDCNRDKIVMDARDHMAPCTDMAFSPVSSKLILSAGLDKKCFFYDIENNAKVATIANGIRMEEPLWAVEIFPDGKTVALGTETGKVLFYDMRKMHTPLHVLSGAHAAKVTAIQFQPRTSGKTQAKDAKENIQPPSLSSPTSVTPASVTSLLARSGDSTSSQVFSPLRDAAAADLHFSPSGDSPGGLSHRSSSIGRAHLSYTASNDSSIFSPIRDASSTSSRHYTPSPLISPLVAIREEDDIPSALETLISTVPPAAISFHSPAATSASAAHIRETPKFSSTRSSSGLQRAAVRNLAQTNGPATAAAQSLESQELVRTIRSPRGLSEEEKIVFDYEAKRILSSVFPRETIGYDSDNAAGTTNTPEAAATANSGSGAQAFHEQYVKSCVRDAMDDYFYEMRQQLWEMRYATIRMAQQQSEQIDQAFHDYAGSDQLVRENEALKREIDELKKFF